MLHGKLMRTCGTYKAAYSCTIRLVVYTVNNDSKNECVPKPFLTSDHATSTYDCGVKLGV